MGDRLVGSHFLPPRLTGTLHHEFLRNVLPEVLQGVDLQTRIHLWFLHDGGLPNFLPVFREFLINVFPEKRIGRG